MRSQAAVVTLFTFAACMLFACTSANNTATSDWLLGSWVSETDVDNWSASSWEFEQGGAVTRHRDNGFDGSWVSRNGVQAVVTWRDRFENETTMIVEPKGECHLIVEESPYSNGETMLVMRRRTDSKCRTNADQFLPAEVAMPLNGDNQVISITISDAWNGLSDISPILDRVKLKHNGEIWTGESLLAVGRSYDDNYLTASQSISVPDDVVQQVIERLVNVPIENGLYKPLIETTDDYPSIEITLRLSDGGVINYSSQSQGRTHVPWRVSIDGVSYRSFSTRLAEGMQLLQPFTIDKSLREQLYEEFRASYDENS